MSKLYIANATRQIHAFMYRAPDDDGGDPRRASAPRTQYIHPGQQIQISGEFSRAQIDNITDQHRQYGLIAVDDIDRHKPFAGICFSVDKPISAGRIHQLMGHNVEVLQERGREMRKLAAISINNSLETDMLESRMPGELKKVEFEVTELRTERSDADEMAPERIRISRADDATQPPRRRKAA